MSREQRQPNPLEASSLHGAFHSFSQLSEFLRSAMADETSREFSDSMEALSIRIETLSADIRCEAPHDVLAPLLLDLLEALRAHRALVVNLPTGWRELYEYGPYLTAVNHFRVLLGHWITDPLQERAPGLPQVLEFERIAWRMLGEGLMLLDLADQARRQQERRDEQASELSALEQKRLDGAAGWWRRWRGS